MNPWKQTYCGVAYDLQNPTPEMVVDIDVAHSLAHINRYGGHGREFFSVAEHCVLGAQFMEKAGFSEARVRAFLLHDAHEFVTGDLAGPAKACIPGWEAWEHIHEVNMRNAANAHPTLNTRRDVKLVDLAMLAVEREALLGPSPRSWGESVEGALPIDVTIRCWTPKQARYEYAKMAQRLGVTLNGKPWRLPAEWVR